MGKTKSNRAASRYLNCSYQHYKKWAKLYKSDKEEYDTLFDEHLNQAGVGIPKYLTKGGELPSLIDIIEGRADPSSFDPQKIKWKLIADGHLDEECKICGFKERRVGDYKLPLLLHFKDGNKQNWREENLELLCYNHYFLTVGDIFTDKQIKGLEDHKPVNEGQVEWEMDSYTRERLETLFNKDKKDNDNDPYSLVPGR